MNGIITFGGNHYRFEGWYFEVHRYLGPIWLRKNGDPRECATPPQFWKMYERFSKLATDEKEKYLEWKSPGCVRF